MRRNRRNTTAILAAAVMGIGLAGVAPAFGANGTWQDSDPYPTDTNWSNSANWVSGTIATFETPPHTGNAIFNGAGGDPLTVTSDSNRKILDATFNNHSSYILDGSGELILQKLIVEGPGTMSVSAPLRFIREVTTDPHGGHAIDVKHSGRTVTFDGLVYGHGGWDLHMRGNGTINFTGQVLRHQAGGNAVLANVAGNVTVNFYNSAPTADTTLSVRESATVNLNAQSAIRDGVGVNGNGSVFVNHVNALDSTSVNRHVNVSGSGAGSTALLQINHAQSYVGNTFVGMADSAATQGDPMLLVNNPTGSGTGSGDVTVYAGTLGGNGTIINTGARGVTLGSRLETDTSVRSYAKLSPGASAGAVGTLTLDLGDKGLDITGAVADSAGGTLLFDLDTPASSDRIDLPGGVMHIGTGVLEFEDFAFNPLGGFGPGVYTLFDTGATINGTFGGNLGGDIGGFASTIGLSDGGNDIILTVVPEPASLAVLGLAAMGLMARRRRGMTM